MVPSELKQRIAELAPRFGIRMALVFGSMVSGSLHPRSDLDLAVAFESNALDLDALAELQHELQTCVPGLTLDLAILDRADPLLLQQIAASSELVYGRIEDLLEFRRYAFRRFQDHRRYFRMEREYLRRFLDRLPHAS